MTAPRIEVEGLGQLSRSASRAGPQHAKAMRARFKAVADTVAATARGKVPSRSGRAAGSIRGQGDNRGASVIGGRSSVPYYGWLDFGGQLRPTGRRRNTQHRPRLPRGRFIYVAVDEKRDELVQAAHKAVTDTIREAGL